MNDYWTARRNRMTRISDEFTALAKALTERGCTVFLPKRESGYITFLKAYKDGKQLYIELNDLTGDYTLGYDIPPGQGRGSMATIDRSANWPTPEIAEEYMRPCYYSTEVDDLKQRHWYLVKFEC